MFVKKRYYVLNVLTFSSSLTSCMDLDRRALDFPKTVMYAKSNVFTVAINIVKILIHQKKLSDPRRDIFAQYFLGLVFCKWLSAHGTGRFLRNPFFQAFSVICMITCCFHFFIALLKGQHAKYTFAF